MNFTAGDAAVNRFAGVTAGVEVIDVVVVATGVVAGSFVVAEVDVVAAAVVEGLVEGALLVAAGLHPVTVRRVQRRTMMNEDKYFTLAPAK